MCEIIRCSKGCTSCSSWTSWTSWLCWPCWPCWLCWTSCSTHNFCQLFITHRLGGFLLSQPSKFIHQQKLIQWRQIIADRRASGLTIVEYTRQHQISRFQYYYWLRRIRTELLDEHAEELRQSEPGAPERVLEAHQESTPEETAHIHEGASAEPAEEIPSPVLHKDSPCRPDFVPVPVRQDSRISEHLAVSCGPFQFELTADTPPSLLRKLAAACGGAP